MVGDPNALPAAAAAADEVRAVPQGPAIMEITFNGLPAGESVVWRRNDEVLVKVSDLQEWRMKPSSLPPDTLDGQNYVPLEAFEGLIYKIDDQRQTLEITAPAALMETASVDAGRYKFTDPTESAFGAFLNYSAVAQAYRGTVNASGFIENGVSGRWGLLLNSFVASNFAGQRAFTRFDTTYVWDDPAKPVRLTVGDAIAPGGITSQSLRFGGIGYGTDFNLQPELATFPAPTFTGQAALPSTVQVYVNNVLTYTGNVDQGPFTLNRIPVMTGGGNLRLVVRDALGVERLYNVPYYAASNNLAEGLASYYVAAGALRDNYGFNSFDYGHSFVTGTYRRGISDRFTVEAHAEGERNVQMAAGAVALIVPNIGEFGATGGGSTGRGADGLVGGVSFRRESEWWNLFLNYKTSTDRFAQVGFLSGADQISTEAAAVIGFAAGPAGNISVAYTKLDYRSGLKSDVTTVSHNVQIGNRLQINTFALVSRTNNSKTQFSIGVGLSIPIGTRAGASARIDRQQGATVESVDYRRSAPSNTGFGYGLSARHGAGDYLSGDVTWRTPFNVLQAQVEHRNGAAAAMLQASGSAGVVDGDTFLAREINDAYAKVDLAGHAGVTVYQENRAVARTGADGVAILTGLNAYQSNRITIDSDSLPIGSQLRSSQINLVPRYRGAVAAVFPVTNTRSGTVTLLRRDGNPVAPGATVRIAGQTVPTYVGYRGEVFFTDLRDDMALTIDDEGGQCTASIGKIPPGEVLPQLPPITCEGKEQKK